MDVINVEEFSYQRRVESTKVYDYMVWSRKFLFYNIVENINSEIFKFEMENRFNGYPQQ